MKIISYSDLHLEFGHHFLPTPSSDADVMILAGDIMTFKNHRPLTRLLHGWEKPVLYVTGNHEYYTHQQMDVEDIKFKNWLAEHHPNVTFLHNEAVTIDGVHFFGGTMWTDFYGASPNAMNEAQHQMNDYRYIMMPSGGLLTPDDTIMLHNQFAEKLLDWFEQALPGERVVITHHAPVMNPNTQYGNSPLMPAFNSLDMLPVIEKYQPRLWVYGHTHECDNHTVGRTQIISNQLGYPQRGSEFECQRFDKAGLLVTI